MMLSDDQREAVFETDVNDRNGVRDVAARWPNRTVVYHINEEDFGLSIIYVYSIYFGRYLCINCNSLNSIHCSLH